MKLTHLVLSLVLAFAYDGIAVIVNSANPVQALTKKQVEQMNGEPSGLAKQFVDFTIDPAGQKIVAQVGFVPIK